MSHDRNEISLSADKRGVVYRSQGLLLRDINPEFAAFYSALLKNNPVLTRLYAKGLVDTQVHNESDGSSHLVLRHKELPFISFWGEWSYGMIRDAAIATISIAEELEDAGLSMYDAHPYNIIFDYGKPVFVDLTSIRDRQSSPFHVWRTSFITEFLVPLQLEAKKWNSLKRRFFYLEDSPSKKDGFGRILDRSWYAWRALLSGEDKKPALSYLRHMVEKVGNRRKKTQWADYYQRNNSIVYGDTSTYTHKETSVLAYLNTLKSKGMTTVLDVASNEGWFSFAAEDLGYNVVAFDYDINAIEALYQKIRGTDKRILPLVMDFTAPTRAHGPNGMWRSATDRLQCDITLSIAITHHLVLGQNVSFETYASTIAKFTRQYAIVEFIGADDQHIRKMVRGKESWYTLQNFITAMSASFEYLESKPSEPATRQLLLFKKKTA
jgi:hypothetical protein